MPVNKQKSAVKLIADPTPFGKRIVRIETNNAAIQMDIMNAWLLREDLNKLFINRGWSSDESYIR